RYVILLCLSVLLYGTKASPYKSWGKEMYPAAQDTRSHDLNESKFMLGLKEVEPVEKQDLKEVDIDPYMALRKAMKQYRQQKHDKPEEVEHLAANMQGQLYQEAEKDLDAVYHNIQGIVSHDDLKEQVVQPEITLLDKAEVMELHKESVYMSPEEDKDGLHHGDFIGQVFQVSVIEDLPEVYTEPEEDRDHLFHN
ncbi:hypothetical protein C0J50_15376, partial [Silurus asotus]